MSAATSHGDIALRLLQAGASATARSDRNWTPLHAAAFGGSQRANDVVQALLAAGAAETVAVADSSGSTPLHLATAAPVIHALLAAGADANARDQYGATPLHHVMKGGSDYSRAAAALIAAGSDVNARTTRDDLSTSLGTLEAGSTPLHVAALTGEPAVAKCLIDRAADPALADANGQTPLTRTLLQIQDLASIAAHDEDRQGIDYRATLILLAREMAWQRRRHAILCYYSVMQA